MNEKDLRKQILHVFEHQRFAVIATERNGQPYTHLVAFTFTPDLRTLLFATRRDTQKYLNIMENAYVSVLIDNRENTPSDFSDAMTVNALGRAAETTDQNKVYRELLLRKHPNLLSFLDDPACVLIEVHIMTYQVVQKFENIDILKIPEKKT